MNDVCFTNAMYALIIHLQIAAVHEETEFSIYMMPTQPITAGASAVNKLKNFRWGSDTR